MDLSVPPGSGLCILLALLLGMSLIGCGDATTPTGPESSGFHPGDIFLLEGSLNWSTDSVTWTHRGMNGRVADDRFGMIAVATNASLTGPSHFFFAAEVGLVCNDDECFPAHGEGWAQADLEIFYLDWSSVGAQVTFVGREVFSPIRVGPPFIYVMPAGGGEPRKKVSGNMPSFSRDGSRIVYVNRACSVVKQFNVDAVGNPLRDLATGAGIEHPRLSPGDSLLAFSATTLAGGRRIMVADVRDAGLYPDTVSDADGSRYPTQDGTGDNYPSWSPSGRYLAYMSTVRNGNAQYPAIFVTTPAMEPENVIKVAAFSPADHLANLRWHPTDGSRMLFTLNNDVYMLIMPERYWAE